MSEAQEANYGIETDGRSWAWIEHDIFTNHELLTGDEKFLYIILLHHGRYRKEGNDIFPSLSTLALEMCKSKRTVQRAMDGLVAKGVLKKTVRKREDGGWASNLYTLVNTRELWASAEEKARMEAEEEARVLARLRARGATIIMPGDATQPDSKPTTGKATTKRTRKTNTAPSAPQAPVDGIAMANTAYALVTGEKRKANTIAVPITVTEE